MADRNYSSIIFNDKRLDDNFVAGMGLDNLPYLDFYLQTAKALNDEMQKVYPDCAFKIDYDRIDAIMILADSKGAEVVNPQILSDVQRAFEKIGFAVTDNDTGLGRVNVCGRLTVNVDSAALSKDKAVQNTLLSAVSNKFADNLKKPSAASENNGLSPDKIKRIFDKIR